MAPPRILVRRLLTASVLLGLVGVCLAMADESASGYTPVATPRALHTALHLNLKIVQDWINDKDYASAAQSAQGLIVLAQLYGYQSTQKDWQQRTKTLAEASGRLLAAARKKDAAGCEKSARECAELLDGLAKQPPSGPKVSVKNFATFGSTKTWMVLMDGAYVDAKSSKKPAELEDLAFTLAETLNVSSHLRSDPKWRTMAVEARQLALAVAARAAAQDVDGARRELKHVYNACEACHQGTKKK